MRILQFNQWEENVGGETKFINDQLVVEMTQEEYQLACHAIIEKRKK